MKCSAQSVPLSQPAVSAQLVRLRALFGDPLLIPAQRGMTPTAMAEELLGPLRLALAQVRAPVGEQMHFDPAQSRLTVAIASTDYLQFAILRPLILALRRLAPSARVAVRTLDMTQLARSHAHAGHRWGREVLRSMAAGNTT